MKLQYRETKWFAGEVPDPKNYNLDYDKIEYQDSYNEALDLALEAFKPIAPQDQEKVKRFVYDSYINEDVLHYSDFSPEIGKLYDSGDLVFELKEFVRYIPLIENHPEWEEREEGYPQGGEQKDWEFQQFWVLKKAKEEISKELRSVRQDLFSTCEKAILNAQYELEKVGASEGLTKAATLLSEARQLVTNYLYEKENN